MNMTPIEKVKVKNQKKKKKGEEEGKVGGTKEKFIEVFPIIPK